LHITEKEKLMRRMIVAGNWKMNQDRAAGITLISAIAELAAKEGLSSPEAGVQVVLCPPLFLIHKCTALTQGFANFATGAQNCHFAEQGAYTGEVSAPMLKAEGAAYVIIGHSERRQYFGEDDALLAQKTASVLQHGLTPIFCCGEVLQEREAGHYKAVVRKQLEAGLFGLDAATFGKVVIAYEPVWAIGTGKTATPEQAQEMHHEIRSMISQRYGQDVADVSRILYGGSCNAANAAELFAQPDVDGGLIGGASLKANDFIAIIRAAHQQIKGRP
jgi:triosephosphate isomerase